MATRCCTRLLRQSASGSLLGRNAAFRIQASPSAPVLPSLAALSRYYASSSFPPHTIISMPALSPTMTAGNIGAWQKKVGDTLSPGDVLVEIETDKAQMDFEFQEEGVLAKILKQTGEKEVAVGSPIAVLVEEGDDVSAFESFTLADAGGDKQAASSQPAAAEEKAAAAAASAAAEESTAEPADAVPQAQESHSTGGRLETSLDRYRAQKAEEKTLATTSGAGGAASAAAGPAYIDTPASSMRKTIAARLTESVNQNPHYFVSTALSVSKLLKLRESLNASSGGAYKLSVNDFLIKASAVALKKVPAVNSSWREINGEVVIREHQTVDVSVAVATPAGLVTPIVKNVESIGLASISCAVKDLGKRARDGKLKPEEYQGGSFTISNLGMNHAVERFTAVINPPQAAILAVGTTRKVAIPVETEDGTDTEWDDQIVVTASFDHKVVDGAVGAEWIRELKKVVENPLELLL